MKETSALKYYKLGTTTANLNMRDGAGTDKDKVTLIPGNTPIAILGSAKYKGDIWYKTQYLSGSKLYTGYVISTYIK